MNVNNTNLLGTSTNSSRMYIDLHKRKGLKVDILSNKNLNSEAIQ